MEGRTAMDWTTTPEGTRKYRAARERAHAQADSLGLDVGIERVDMTREFRTFLLPRPGARWSGPGSPARSGPTRCRPSPC
jgi:hypothetical protein